ncbi:ASCH domain-containing protein [Variovorax sp. LARHSF232]
MNDERFRTKRATATSLWSLERLPAPGDLSIVTNWSGAPLCIIETLAVDVVPFNEVGAEFAATEGEGDGSLAYWQEAHRPYFASGSSTGLPPLLDPSRSPIRVRCGSRP